MLYFAPLIQAVCNVPISSKDSTQIIRHKATAMGEVNINSEEKCLQVVQNNM